MMRDWKTNDYQTVCYCVNPEGEETWENLD